MRECGMPRTAAVRSRIWKCPCELHQTVDSAVRLPPRGRGVRLNVALVDGLRAEYLLDDQIGLCETLLDVAENHLRVAGDIAFVVGVELGRAVGYCLLDVGNGGQDFVLDLNQVEGFLGGVRALRGDGGDCLSLVERLLTGEAVVAEVLDVRGRAGDNHARLVGGVGEVRRG